MDMINYFRSTRDMYIFILIYMDGASRCRMLGITDEMYDNKDLAKVWYRNILSAIAQDSFFPPDEHAAIKVLNSLYSNMIEEDEE